MVKEDEMVIARSATLRSQVADELRKDIIEGRYAPGNRLIERDLSERYDVSRTVIREALRVMEAESLVVVEPYRGPSVKALSLAEITHLYEVREILESAACGLAAERADADQFASISNTLENIATADAADIDARVGFGNAFYESIVEAANNPLIGTLLSNVQTQISQLRRVTLSTPGREIDLLTELRPIVDAIKQGDRGGAEKAASRHVRAAAEIARNVLTDRINGPATATASGG
ncbi:MAG TPA: GntR family transcriptional regulator [Candidatus Agrococcus pullicola]|uniref:GntR family transcriptional regulator n=1 Tax=Candidatus Agrococcus pullicola TaxID=2838429 RepID=A0A9D2C8J9_9MICO|nr:GntR family transcriptional regulator [Candidatus Agrococcus pullicola]